MTTRNPRMQVAILPGGRLHLNDGPIDLVICAEGEASEMRKAYAAATHRFTSVLDELCAELPLLRSAMHVGAPRPDSVVAQRMDAAVRPLSKARFITRMAAVAGAVADEILAAMCGNASLAKAYVNNGGDIAVHLSPGAVFDIAMVGLSDAPHAFGNVRIRHDDAVRGIATSGFGGRSFSLGIADAVTILANDAASADAAATLVANAVDLPGHPAIRRAPARDFDPQSDLGERLVTRAVGILTESEVTTALAAGAREAQRLADDGQVIAAALSLRGQVRIVGSLNSSINASKVAHVC